MDRSFSSCTAVFTDIYTDYQYARLGIRIKRPFAVTSINIKLSGTHGLPTHGNQRMLDKNVPSLPASDSSLRNQPLSATTAFW
eukprot:365114-Chlamydomonas_euryale.AAC.3